MAAAAVAETPLTTQRVATGLTLPLYVTAPPGDTSRLFIVEQRSGTVGRIRILDLNTMVLNPTPFLSVSPVTTGNEQGLLGFAFAPDYATTGRFYVNYTDSGGTTRIARGTVSANPNVANATLEIILSISQPFSNHNGGCLQFSPNDGYLYISSGDGGSANDPQGNGQNINTLLGKILRIDVSTPALYLPPTTNPFYGAIPGRDEIWSYGLRNPWRFSFDRLTGDMYIGDVGQSAREEVDFEPGNDPGGRNYGWRCMEGLNCTGLSGCTCNAPELTLPIHQYVNGSPDPCSITGGYVYRGQAIPDLHGTYFFADYGCTGAESPIWSFRYDGTTMSDFRTRTTELRPSGATINFITSFGEDARGEMYICDQGGEIFKIIPNCAGANLIISQNPQPQTVCEGATVTFQVGLTGAVGAVTYTWRKDGSLIGAPSMSTLVLNDVTAADAGAYSVVVQDQCSTRTSADAMLTVNAGVLGDMNGDCLVNADDAPLFANVLAGVDTNPGRMARADINGDMDLNALDVAPFIALVLP